jgi:hypothetical protein
MGVGSGEFVSLILKEGQRGLLLLLFLKENPFMFFTWFAVLIKGV